MPAGLEALGLQIDEKKNAQRADEVIEIQDDAGSCKILVVPTNEELEIARQTLEQISCSAL